jgi:hypothetical protein
MLLKCSKLCNWYFQRWNCESSDRRTKESNLFCFIRPRYICLPSNYGQSLNYQVAPAKTGLISRGENHSLSWQFLDKRDRNRVRSRQRSLLLRFPAQIETSASRERRRINRNKKCLLLAHERILFCSYPVRSAAYFSEWKSASLYNQYRQTNKQNLHQQMLRWYSRNWMNSKTVGPSRSQLKIKMLSLAGA